MHGFMGKILVVDLTSQTTRVLEKTDAFYKQHLGGAFLAAKLFVEAVDGVDPAILSEELLELALYCLPADHLELLFRRMLADLRQHRSGFPDLIQFRPDHPDPNRRYEMIEVKGPGDRLQDHQTRWLEYCVENRIPVSVCHVRWTKDQP